MNVIQTIAAGLALTAVGSAAAAQSANTLSDMRMRQSHAEAGLVIPFGNSGSAAERVPRLEAWSEDAGRSELRLRTDADPQNTQPVRLGITLNQHPRFIRNGQEVPGQSDHDNISTLGVVGIGVGVALIVFGVVVLNAFNKDNGL